MGTRWELTNFFSWEIFTSGMRVCAICVLEGRGRGWTSRCDKAYQKSFYTAGDFRTPDQLGGVSSGHIRNNPTDFFMTGLAGLD